MRQTVSEIINDVFWQGYMAGRAGSTLDEDGNDWTPDKDTDKILGHIRLENKSRGNGFLRFRTCKRGGEAFLPARTNQVHCHQCQGKR